MQPGAKVKMPAVRKRNSYLLTTPKGPKISVHVEMRGEEILSSRLTLSDQFICTGANAVLIEWFKAYAEGKAKPFSLEAGSLFQKRVMQALNGIPFGQIISYQELAAICGAPKAARAIGNACARNPFPLFVPCHRVIRSNGKLGGFACDLEIKRRLLEFEAG